MKSQCFHAKTASKTLPELRGFFHVYVSEGCSLPLAIAVITSGSLDVQPIQQREMEYISEILMSYSGLGLIL